MFSFEKCLINSTHMKASFSPITVFQSVRTREKWRGGYGKGDGFMDEEYCMLSMDLTMPVHGAIILIDTAACFSSL